MKFRIRTDPEMSGPFGYFVERQSGRSGSPVWYFENFSVTYWGARWALKRAVWRTVLPHGRESKTRYEVEV